MAKDRESWKSSIGFILAAVGSAVGLGNIWRFSYMAYENGGGAFLIPYLVALLTAGLPILILEFGIGHKMRGAPPTAFFRVRNHEGSHFQGLGWWGVTLAMFGINIYYGVVISWCIQFVISSFSLDWAQAASTSAFFFSETLNATGGIWEFSAPVIPILLGLAVVWFLNWFIVYKGIQGGIEKANKIFMPVLVVLISILVVRGLTLEGAGAGLAQYLTPQFDKLLDPNVWIDAYAQVFFTLSVGFGIMIAYASYLPKKANIVGNAKITAFLNCAFSLFTGLAVFSTLGYLAAQKGVPVDEVARGGVGLAFIVFPEAIAQIPVLPQLFGFIFFLALLVAGLSSSLSLVEAFASSTVDKFGWTRKKIVTLLSLIGFGGGVLYTMGNGIYWLDMIDRFMTSYGLVTVGLLQSLVIGWIYGARSLRRHINFASDRKMGAWFDISLKYITPIILLLVLGVKINSEFVSLLEKDASKVAIMTTEQGRTEMDGEKLVSITVRNTNGTQTKLNWAELQELQFSLKQENDDKLKTEKLQPETRKGLTLALAGWESMEIVDSGFDKHSFQIGQIDSLTFRGKGFTNSFHPPGMQSFAVAYYPSTGKVLAILSGMLFLFATMIAAGILARRKWQNEDSLKTGHHFEEGEDYHLH